MLLLNGSVVRRAVASLPATSHDRYAVGRTTSSSASDQLIVGGAPAEVEGEEWGASACERDEERRLGLAMANTAVAALSIFALGVIIGMRAARQH